MTIKSKKEIAMEEIRDMSENPWVVVGREGQVRIETDRKDFSRY